MILNGSPFFHARATINHRRNAVTCLTNTDGKMVYDHHSKVDLLWNSYKERLDTSEFEKMHFDLQSLINEVDSLDRLEELTKEEIDIVIAELLPSNKSPGPDGFNGDFLKKCWPIIAEDFYDL